MSKDEQAIEQEIREKGLTAPRLTPAHIDGAIHKIQYHVFTGTMLTACALTLQNGFIFTVKVAGGRSGVGDGMLLRASFAPLPDVALA